MRTHADTIAAVASGVTPAERAILRLSGPATNDLLAAWTRAPDGSPTPVRRGCSAVFLRLTDNPSPIELPCLLLRFVAPASYTGEDAAELLIPGNPLVASRVLDRLTNWPGVRQAEPGEFTARAYLAGKLTLEQAEGVAAVIAAENERELDSARRVLTGRSGAAYRVACDELAAVLALVEAGIDFTDQEDVRPIEAADLVQRLAAVRTTLEHEVGPVSTHEQRSSNPTVVLAGPPNAGKSTLFNALLARPRAIVSEQAGTTRDVLREPLDLADDTADPSRPAAVTLCDLAGLDATLATRTPIDAEAQRLARTAIEHADVVVWCDPTGRFEAHTIGPSLADFATTIIHVRTKADVPGEHRNSESHDALAVCAIDGRNLGPLRRAIADVAFGRDANSSPLAAVLPRHRRAASDAMAAIDDANRLVEDDPDVLLHAPELVAAALRSALDSVGSLVGQVTPDDVIGRVFATFCVGK